MASVSSSVPAVIIQYWHYPALLFWGTVYEEALYKCPAIISIIIIIVIIIIIKKAESMMISTSKLD